jgi:hypothetical protein
MWVKRGRQERIDDTLRILSRRKEQNNTIHLGGNMKAILALALAAAMATGAFGQWHRYHYGGRPHVAVAVGVDVGPVWGPAYVPAPYYYDDYYYGPPAPVYYGYGPGPFFGLDLSFGGGGYYRCGGRYYGGHYGGGRPFGSAGRYSGGGAHYSGAGRFSAGGHAASAHSRR